MCCLAAGTSRDQSALAEVRSMVARTKVADCGQTGAEGLQRHESNSHSMIFSFCNCIKLMWSNNSRRGHYQSHIFT
jgi:hypothetical protein